VETFNHTLFLAINATPSSPDWLLTLAQFFAQDLIVLVPATLVILWFWSSRRKLVVNTATALVIAVAITSTIRAIYPHTRPFVDGVGYQFMAHSASASFPSNHGTLIFTFAFAFLFWQGRKSAAVLFSTGLLIAWSRIYLGVHWPIDMVGAALVGLIACAIAQIILPHVGQPVLQLAEQGYRLLFSPFIRKGWIKN
jgi:undecaprenyl-diphosphatase